MLPLPPIDHKYLAACQVGSDRKPVRVARISIFPGWIHYHGDHAVAMATGLGAWGELKTDEGLSEEEEVGA